MREVLTSTSTLLAGTSEIKFGNALPETSFCEFTATEKITFADLLRLNLSSVNNCPSAFSLPNIFHIFFGKSRHKRPLGSWMAVKKIFLDFSVAIMRSSTAVAIRIFWAGFATLPFEDVTMVLNQEFVQGKKVTYNDVEAYRGEN